MTTDDRELAVLPPGLRDRVLAASRQARAGGHSVGEVVQISPAEAFSRSADGLHGLLRALREEDWRRPVLRDLDVQGLVGHLIGVESDMHRCLSGDRAVADADHVQSTQPAAVGQAGQPPAQTRARWFRAIRRTLTLVSSFGDLEARFALHGMRLPLGGLLVARAFELWTHDNDIRRAAGLPLTAPDPATLRRMTELAAALLPHGAASTGLREPLGVRLVLTGPGGGTWDVAVGDGCPRAAAEARSDHAYDSPAAVSIVTDAVGFCRLVANRLTPDQLDLHVMGDPDRAARVLAAASALALD
jgi:uncharacterized protein (TIGR03083 family)